MEQADECKKLFDSGDIEGAKQILESACANKTRFLMEYNQGPSKTDAFVLFAVKHGCKVYNLNYNAYVVMNMPNYDLIWEDDLTKIWTGVETT